MTKDISQKFKIISLLSMVMVIFLHSYNIKNTVGYLFEPNTFFSFFNIFIQNIISQGLARIAVPIFFLLSGYLFFKNFNFLIYKDKIAKRVYTLLIPYLFWAALSVFIYFILQSIPGFSHFFKNELIQDLSFQQLIIKTWIDPTNYPLWFLRDLMLLIIISPLLFYLIKKIPVLFFSLLSVQWFFNIPETLLSLNSEPILFFSVGAYFSIISDKFLSIKILNKNLIYLLSIYLIILIIKAVILTIYPSYAQMLILTIIHKISILLGIVILWFVLDRYKLSKMYFLTNFTFLFYVFHEPTLTILKKAGYSVLGKSSLSSFFLYIIAPIVIIIFLTILGHILKKYYPKIASIITGNRL